MLNAPTAEAKKITFAHVFADGCVGTHTYHSILGGLIQWETYDVIDCP